MTILNNNFLQCQGIQTLTIVLCLCRSRSNHTIVSGNLQKISNLSKSFWKLKYKTCNYVGKSRLAYDPCSHKNSWNWRHNTQCTWLQTLSISFVVQESHCRSIRSLKFKLVSWNNKKYLKATTPSIMSFFSGKSL